MNRIESFHYLMLAKILPKNSGPKGEGEPREMDPHLLQPLL